MDQELAIVPESVCAASSGSPASPTANATTMARRRSSSAPTVAVVITCYNQGQFLSEAIESALNQTITPSEVIVVDDGSTDSTPEVARRYPNVQYFQQHNMGLSAARNAGLYASTAESLIFLDADDRLLPIAVESGVACLSKHPDCALVHGHFRYVNVDGSFRSQPPLPPPMVDPYRMLLHGNYISMHATVLYRRETFDSVGGFDTSLGACEDYEIYLRIARRFPIAGHHAIVAEYRRHGESMSRDRALMLRSAITVLRRQRRYVKGCRDQMCAYHAGIQFWQSYYGGQLTAQIARNLTARTQWREVINGTVTLSRYHPHGISTLLRAAVLRGNQRAYSWLNRI